MTMTKHFVEGFIRAMKDIQDNCVTESISKSDLSYLQSRYRGVWGKAPYDYGYIAGIDHFNGEVTNDVNYAYEIGLIDAYADFWGQSDWTHPENWCDTGTHARFEDRVEEFLHDNYSDLLGSNGTRETLVQRVQLRFHCSENAAKSIVETLLS